MFPAVILALILPALRDRVTRRGAPAGAAIALATAPFLPLACPCCWPWPGWPQHAAHQGSRMKDSTLLAA